MLAISGPELAVLIATLLTWLMVAGLGVALCVFAFWLWMLIHALRNPGLNDGERISWTVVLCLTHLLGAILYFFLGRPKAATPHGAAGAGPVSAPGLQPVRPPAPAAPPPIPSPSTAPPPSAGPAAPPSHPTSP
jgi:hypothetical protein